MKLLAVLRSDDSKRMDTALLWVDRLDPPRKHITITKITDCVCSTADAKELTDEEEAWYLAQARESVKNIEGQLGITGPRGLPPALRLDLWEALMGI